MPNKHDVTVEHIQVHTITEYEHFPEHDARVTTLEFRNSKHELEVVEHLPCYICQTMDNRESHHIFERSLWNGLDVKLVSHYLFNHFDFHGHVLRDFKSADELCDWFMKHFNGRVEDDVYMCDDDAADTLYNQWILCADHHRSPSIGIHGSTTPSFFAWLARQPKFEPTFTSADAQQWKLNRKEV